MKYFYIIMRNGSIHEIPFTEESYRGAFEQLSSKGIIATIPKGQLLPIAINSVDISQILTEDSYDNYIAEVKPKQYLLNGTWYDGKENRVIRHENWKLKEIENKPKLKEPEASSVNARKKLDEMREYLRGKISIR